MDKLLKHYGMPRRSGRYPYGSGKNPIQRYETFLKRVNELEKLGFTDTEIAKDMEMKTQTLRAKRSIANDEIKKSENAVMLRLRDKGWSGSAIAKRFGLPNESTVRSRLDPVRMQRTTVTENIANILKDEISKSEWIDIGPGIPGRLGIAPTKLTTAVAYLKEKGYQTRTVPAPQGASGNITTVKVLMHPDASYHELMKSQKQIGIVYAKSTDGGLSFDKPEPPVSISSSRVKVNYAEDGGSPKDGLIELRRGVEDLNLGNARYAQVRIAVDGKQYLKGMAMYSDDVPSGYDIVFNSSKKAAEGKALKNLDFDSPINQFGSAIKPDEKLDLIRTHYTDSNGERKQSALNIVNEEGDWGAWRKTISSQVLSKQPAALAKQQLKEAYDMKKEEYDEIMSLTEPSVKKKLLESFSEDCDSSAVHLKAASLPRQKSQVILPFPEMKETEIFAPNFNNGERVVLIRYPHGGIFEIPELTVNNNYPVAKKLINQAKDAVGINPKVAERLSGADFDGDSVLVIPNNSGAILTSSPLEGLKNYDHLNRYKLPPDAPTISGSTKQQEMGRVSNLITDMTIKGAPPEEICYAVKHSMVVIDAQKHHLDYKQSYIDNGIAALKQRYQGKVNAGASTIISKAAASDYIPEREFGKWIYDKVTGTKRRLYIDPSTGKKLYEVTGNTYSKKTIKPPDKIDPETGKVTKFKDVKVHTDTKTKQKYYKLNGEVVYISDESQIKEKTLNKTTKTTKMAVADDAYSLTSDKRGGFLIEQVYADHANKLKALANEARKEAIFTQPRKTSISAQETYSEERKSLLSKVRLAISNKPFERRALLLAKKHVDIIKAENPAMDDDELKTRQNRALVNARNAVGSKKVLVDINDREWEAIQSGAVNKSLLKDILDNADMAQVKQRAMPRTTKGMSAAKVARARSMMGKGSSQSDVAEALGVSVTTLMSAINP